MSRSGKRDGQRATSADGCVRTVEEPDGAHVEGRMLVWKDRDRSMLRVVLFDAPDDAGAVACISSRMGSWVELVPAQLRELLAFLENGVTGTTSRKYGAP